MQLDIILTSLQDHTHVASLLGYSSPADGPEVLSSGPGFTALPDPAYGATAGHPDTHLAEILMKTLLRNLGFYTVSRENIRFAFIDFSMPLLVGSFRIDKGRHYSDRKSASPWLQA